MADLYTAGSGITSEPPAARGAAVDYIGRYTANLKLGIEPSTLVDLYWFFGVRAGINPLLAFAQACHETGRFTSWWCQAPRRNPAGIRVSGVKRSTPPPSGEVHWAERHPGTLWLAGQSFPDWPTAVATHIGLLRVYAGRPVSPWANVLARFSRNGRDPESHPCFSTVVTLEQLGHLRNPSGKGWAYGPHSDTYGDGIAKHANAIINTPVPLIAPLGAGEGHS